MQAAHICAYCAACVKDIVVGEVLVLFNRWPASCPALARAYCVRSVLAACLQVSGTGSLLAHLNVARPNPEIITPNVSFCLLVATCNRLLMWCHSHAGLSVIEPQALM